MSLYRCGGGSSREPMTFTLCKPTGTSRVTNIIPVAPYSKVSWTMPLKAGTYQYAYVDSLTNTSYGGTDISDLTGSMDLDKSESYIRFTLHSSGGAPYVTFTFS